MREELKIKGKEELTHLLIRRALSRIQMNDAYDLLKDQGLTLDDREIYEAVKEAQIYNDYKI